MTVPLAVMPEGVEHQDSAESDTAFVVPLAVMPEGVEHMEFVKTLSLTSLVQLTVMQEGVEHGPSSFT